MTQDEIAQLRYIHSEHHGIKWQEGCDCKYCKKYESYCQSICKIIAERQQLKGAH